MASSSRQESGTPSGGGPPSSRPPRAALLIGSDNLTVEQLVRAAAHGAALEMTSECKQRMSKSCDLLRDLLDRGEWIYGVNTGIGESQSTDVGIEAQSELARNLVHHHGCGTGRYFTPVQSRAIVVARVASLCRGYSGVRPLVVERLLELMRQGVVPRIPSEGSAGAGGDSIPLSYVAAMLMGEREVWYEGVVHNTEAQLGRLGLRPLELLPKESLALMNGTSVMTGLAALALHRLQRLCRWSSALTAMCVDATRGQPGHFHPRIFELKPHPGQAQAARWIREDLGVERVSSSVRSQDPYSLRCAPHVIGVLLDHLPPAVAIVETELNSVNDNPIVDIDHGELHHGGNFYGGHICQVMDTLKTAAANLADLVDRQLLLACHPASNGGLPSNLVAAEGRAVHHGFKAMQIATSALAAEAAKLTMPASVFSRSTENHNQDKVSLGSIAARDCLRIVELTETALAIATLAMAQAVELRGIDDVGPRAQRIHGAVRRRVPPHREDRRMDVDIDAMLTAWRAGRLPVGESELT